MRVSIPALFALALVAAPAAAQAPQDDAPFARFDRSVAATKKAMMGDPQQALRSAEAAVALARRLPPGRRAEVDAVTARWLEGEALLFLNDAARAQPIIEDTLLRAERVAPNTKLHGDLLRSHGAVAAMKGDTLQALRDYQRAHDVFRTAGEARSRAMALQDIGQIYWEAGDYRRTLSYYEQSAEAYSGDPTLTLTMHNNRAEVFRKLKRWGQAAAAYRAAMVEAKKLDSPLLQVRILTNLASSEADAGRLGSAQAAADQALALAAHGEAAGWRPFIYGTAAKVAYQRGDVPRAAALLERTFAGVDLEKSDLLFREPHQVAALVYERLGQSDVALRHLKAFQRLEGETQELTASAASQLMAARFDFTNQNLKISKLEKEQLRRDIELRTWAFTAAFVVGAGVFGMLLFGFLQLRRSRDKVNAANDRLRLVNDRLEHALKAKTEFLATTSHEIRTPLNGILGMTQVLLTDRTVPAPVRERIEVVHGAGETMKALVDDILDVAKMESGELTVVSEPTDLPAILEDARKLWSGQAQGKGLTLSFDVADAPRRIMSDGGRLRQIVLNLMSNALKFTHQGGVTLRARAEGDELVIAVTDTGIGIPADKQALIFEAFRQVDGGTTRQYGGTGLGLSICLRLAEALGGAIDVASVPGEGATFTVRLPLQLAAEADPAETEQVVGPGLAEARLLLLERDPANGGVLRLMLAAESGSLAVALSVEEAEAALATGEVDHVVADWSAVAEGGAAQALADAADAGGARLSLLLPAEAVAGAMLLGATQLVVKPIGAGELIAALASLYGPEPESFVAPILTDARAA